MGQAAEGSTYGIVPYIDPLVTGSISGIIGAGGSTGAVAFSLCFRQLAPKSAFIIMGSIIMSSSLLSAFIHINDQSVLFYNSQAHSIETQKCKISEEDSATELGSPTSVNTTFSEFQEEKYETDLK